MDTHRPSSPALPQTYITPLSIWSNMRSSGVLLAVLTPMPRTAARLGTVRSSSWNHCESRSAHAATSPSHDDAHHLARRTSPSDPRTSGRANASASDLVLSSGNAPAFFAPEWYFLCACVELMGACGRAVVQVPARLLNLAKCAGNRELVVGLGVIEQVILLPPALSQGDVLATDALLVLRHGSEQITFVDARTLSGQGDQMEGVEPGDSIEAYAIWAEVAERAVDELRRELAGLQRDGASRGAGAVGRPHEAARACRGLLVAHPVCVRTGRVLRLCARASGRTLPRDARNLRDAECALQAKRSLR